MVMKLGVEKLVFLCLWVNRMDGGQWSAASRSSYNLRDTVSRCTVQVL